MIEWAGECVDKLLSERASALIMIEWAGECVDKLLSGPASALINY